MLSSDGFFFQLLAYRLTHSLQHVAEARPASRATPTPLAIASVCSLEQSNYS